MFKVGDVVKLTPQAYRHWGARLAAFFGEGKVVHLQTPYEINCVEYLWKCVEGKEHQAVRLKGVPYLFYSLELIPVSSQSFNRKDWL